MRTELILRYSPNICPKNTEETHEKAQDTACDLEMSFTVQIQ